jgi:Na+-driven multidrug efflux pump
VAGPAIMSQALVYCEELTNIIFIGQLGNSTLIEAMGLSFLIINSIGFSILMGLNSTLDTLLPQAYGSRDLRLCGIYMHRARLF